MMQKTIKGCGLDAFVQSAQLPYDDIICEDGFICKRGEAYYDSKGGAWYLEEQRNERDVEIVTDVLEGLDKWVTEYTTENTDYADGYVHCVTEGSHNWPDRIEPWLRDTYGDRMGNTDFDDRMAEVVKNLCEALDADFDCEPHYQASDYACWAGKGCCLDSFDIGEYEEQTDINCHDELKALHDAGRLDIVLDSVNCDVHVSRNRKRVKNEETGYYEYVGRETYGADREYACLMTYHMPGGCWHWVVDKERMEELVEEALNGEED